MKNLVNICISAQIFSNLFCFEGESYSPYHFYFKWTQRFVVQVLLIVLMHVCISVLFEHVCMAFVFVHVCKSVCARACLYVCFRSCMSVSVNNHFDYLA
jgi:hypothetical protein